MLSPVTYFLFTGDMDKLRIVQQKIAKKVRGGGKPLKTHQTRIIWELYLSWRKDDLKYYRNCHHISERLSWGIGGRIVL